MRFDIETFVPVTMGDIVEKAQYSIWFTKHHPLIDWLVRLLQSSPSARKIDNQVICLKAEIGDHTFYADRDGTVVEEPTGRTFQLSKPKIRELERKIVYFDGVIDMRTAEGATLKRE